MTNRTLLDEGFQSTLPVWGATATGDTAISANIFQSTLPVWGATVIEFRGTDYGCVFQSTLPVWGATT